MLSCDDFQEMLTHFWYGWWLRFEDAHPRQEPMVSAVAIVRDYGIDLIPMQPADFLNNWWTEQHPLWKEYHQASIELNQRYAQELTVYRDLEFDLQRPSFHEMANLMTQRLP